MAARRLVVVMLVLLAVSTLAAALLPQPERTEEPPPQPRSKPKQPATEGPQANGGVLLDARMRLGRREPKTVTVRSGDQLRLAVTATFGDDVEIPALGLTQPVTPFAPATFDLLASRRGTYPVRAVDSGLVAGRVLVAGRDAQRCGASRPEAPAERASLPSCGPRDGQRSQDADRSARRP